MMADVSGFEAPGMREQRPISWDQCPADSLSRGHLRARFTDLGAAAGSATTGLKRIAIEPGAQSSSAHVHGAEEEIFFVLGGSGLSWQDGETFEVGPGDCLVHLPGGGAADAIMHVAGGEAHMLVAGGEGLDVLAYGARLPDEACFLPGLHVAWLGPTWSEAGEGPDPYDREALAGPVELPEPSPRPARIVNVERVAPDTTDRADVRRDRRDLGTTAGSVRLGLQHVTVQPFGLSSLHHCHACEEELFVVLAGDGSCLLGQDEYPVRRGSVLARPAGSGRPHAFRAGGSGLVLLAFGERKAEDYVYYPRSGIIFFRGVDLAARLAVADLWAVEEALVT